MWGRCGLGRVTGLFLLLALTSAAARAEERITLPTRPGVIQPFYVTRPASEPIASLLLFPGGEGKLQPYRPADLSHGNFLVRSRELFVERGFLVTVLDVPSDHPEGLGSFRLSADHAVDIAAVVAWVRQQAAAPMWLVGTSRGTISAALGAGTAPGVAGLVLTSSVTREGRRDPGTVFDAALGRITVPTLVVSHREDACFASPPAEGRRLLDALSRVRLKELILVEGGRAARSEPCEALSAHGYFGIEPSVVAAIADWIVHPRALSAAPPETPAAPK